MGMTLFLLGLLISGSAAIVLALVILQHREANGTLPFALVMIASAIWAWGYALQISAVSPELALLRSEERRAKGQRAAADAARWSWERAIDIVYAQLNRSELW